MKLINCYIENFGKLHQFEYNFKDGLNVINEENGFGKTTFATFIKSMFYGLDASTNARTENSERKLYLPWQGGLYGGNIEFEINNKKYKIERFFGKKQAEDTFKLYDLSTNLESKDYSENIGEEIFKINKSGYERSTYIPQGKIKIEMEDSINAKLSNVLESDNDINTSEEALNRLNETKKIYQKDRGKGGLIDEKTERLNKLERELENSKTDADTLEIKKQKLDNSIKEIAKIEELRKEKENELSKRIEQDRKDAKKETYKAILAKLDQVQESVDNIKQFSNKKIADLEKGLQKVQNKRKSIQNEVKSSKKIFKILAIIGCILIVLGIILTVAKLQQIVGVVLTALGVISTCISFIISFKNKNNKISEVNDEIKKLEEEKAELQKQAQDLLSKSINQLEDAKREKENFENANNIEELQNQADVSQISEEELKTQITKMNAEIDNLVDTKNQLKNQIEILENKIDENEYLETDIENLKEEIKTITDKYEILSKTETLLKQAKVTFSASYLQGMTNGFNKYLKIIDNKDMSTNVDINLNVKIDSNGGQKEVKYFSSGYKDLIYICMRFSLIEALFTGEKPFVILDDPFVNLDENKTSKALEVLNEFATKYQVIHFVCNSSRTS